MTFEEMLAHQHELQTNHFGGDPATFTGEQRTRFVTAMAMSICAETAEALQEIAWKPWTTDQEWINRDAYLEELVDIFHFLMNLMLVADISAAEFAEVYARKAAINRARMESGSYDGRNKGTEGGKL